MVKFCKSDGSFGPAAGACRGGFDLTLTFEESMLGLLPQILLVLLAPVRLVTLRRRKIRVAKTSYLGFLKLVTTTLYAASSVLLFVLWVQLEGYKTKTSLVSASFELISSLFIFLLSRFEHTRALRPSHLLQIFLLILFLCNAIRLRTLFLMGYSSPLVVSASVHTGLTGALLLLESLSKRNLLLDKGRRLSPEDTIGLFGQKLFWYLNDLFKRGYRQILKPRDLHTIEEELVSETLRETFMNAWTIIPNKNKKHALAGVVTSVLKRDLLFPVLPRLLSMGTTLAQPFLISAMVSYVQKPTNSNTKNEGYGLIAAFALDYIGLAIFSSWYTQNVARFSVKLRGVLVSTIYEKSLHISSQAVNLDSATVLMNVDVEKVVEGVKNMHEFWATIINSGIGLYILYTHLGSVFVAPLVVFVLSTILSSGAGGEVGKRQISWVAATEKRVTNIAYAVASMKGIRMLGLTEVVHHKLSSLRYDEVVAQRYILKLLARVFIISNVLFQITLFVSYIIFAAIALSKKKQFDFEVLFTSLSALKLVTSPMLLALQSIPQAQSAVASLERIQVYLTTKEHTHPTGHGDALTPSQDGIELESISLVDKPTSEVPAPLEIRNGAFETQQGQTLLQDIDLRIMKGTLTLIIGKVASGKSVLLQSLVGEVNISRGQLITPKTGMSFCAQASWLRNATLRDNILGESPFEQHWYDNVSWACGLQHDFREQKWGDLTKVGSRGISLSGGQKNRISLARALYARKPILIIDDILSGLDNTTENLVFTRVFGKDGLLRKAGCTIILATHSAHFAPQADRLIVLSAGRIVGDGSYNQLAAKQGFLEEHSLHEKSLSASPDDVGKESNFGKHDDAEMTMANVAPVEEEEEEDRRTGDMRTLIYYLGAIGKKHITIYTVLTVLSTIATTGQYVYLQELAKASNTAASLKRGMIVFTILTVIDVAVISVWLGHFTLFFIKRSSLSLHAKQLVSLVHARFSYLTATDIGNITNIFSQDIVLVDRQLVFAWLNTTASIIEQTALFAITIAATPPIAALIPFLGLVSYIIQRVYLRTSRQIRLMDLEAKAPLCTNFLETLAGIITIRAMGWNDAYRARNKKLLDESQVPFYLLNAIQNWLKLVLELMVAGLVVVLVGLAVAIRDKIDAGYLGLALVGAMDLGVAVRILVTSWTDLETALSAVARIRRFATNTPLEEQGLPPQPVDQAWPANGSLEFRDLAAAYSEAGTPVIRNINLSIAPGEKVGICGRTGSGKSSLVAALFGLLHRTDGQICINGVPTDAVLLSVLRSKIVALPQEPFFLQSSSVRANLVPWQMPGVVDERETHVTDESMVLALEKVGLWGKFVEAAGAEGNVLDMRLDSIDALLSQGEKQLFCLARATLQTGKIVVLDEATSSVDPATDTLMQKILREAFADRTVIAIAHRLHTILDFDRVIVMDRGVVAEAGEPGILMKQEGSMFKALVEG